MFGKPSSDGSSAQFLGALKEFGHVGIWYQSHERSQHLAEIPFAKECPQTQLFRVSTVQEIKSAIERLPLAQRAALIAELCGWTDDDWDRQMKADAAAGKFAALNEDVGNAYRAGQTKPLDDILGES